MSTTSLKLPDDLFVAEAEAALETSRHSGRGHDADEIHAYLRDRIHGKVRPRPKETAWRDNP